MQLLFNLLLSKGAEVNARNNDLETALYLAVTRGHAEPQAEQFQASSKYSIYTKIVYALLQAGAKISDPYTELSPTTAHLIPTEVMKPNRESLKMLMAAGAEFQEASLFECDDSLQDLIRKCIRKHLKECHPERNLYTTIPQLGLPHQLQTYLLFYTLQKVETNLTKDEKELMHHTQNKNTDKVLSLIQVGIDVDVQDERGMTSLMFASQNGHVDLVAKFIEAGADMNIQSNSGDTALIYATQKNKINCVQKLIELGANINIQGGNGETALIYATRNEDAKCLEALLEGGADPDISNHYGYTTLKEAICNNNSVSLDKLIRAGVNVNYTPVDYPTPLCVAIGWRNIDAVKKLIKAGTDLNVGDPTPLYLAAKEGHTDCVKELIQAGADLNT